MHSVNDIRAAFLDYFAKNGHQIVASSSLVPHNDPTLMFTSAGMVQFKNVFTGLEKRPYQRAVTAQKCLRAGGKHNDLDNVGYTTRHHTFFEMLGNFSFGDYFKDEAIALAWKLITGEFGLPAEKLLVTVYAEDDEAFDLWKKIAGLEESRIIRIATHDNFWAMGDTGPCGPCSEIFYDHGDHIAGGPPGSADENGDRFVEIWNLVFMQYEQTTPQVRIDLPRPSIDTGMGLERIAAVLQGTHDNYETDLFKTLIAASQAQTGVAAQGAHLASHRVIADHMRAASFMITDGVLPANEGRGYVLRRIMRRAMRHGALLGATEPLLYKLLPPLVAQMGQAYPALERARDLIGETLKHEEVRFRKTLDRGLQILADETRELGPGDTLGGDVAFKLYDTYGFPLDLTEDALRARRIGVDQAGFAAAMAHQRETARRAWAGSGALQDERVWFDLRQEHGPTDFLGYTRTDSQSCVLALVAGDTAVERLDAGQKGAVIVNQTPFYARAGGQVGDTGTLSTTEGRFVVEDTTRKADGLFVHHGRVETGTLTIGMTLEMKLDAARRDRVRANHSATHLLHAALRQVLGTHVAQKGSLVAPDRLRFDFSQPTPVGEAELARIEEIVNAVVLQNAPVTTRLMSLDDAIAAGAMALFGETYGDEVRVVSMGLKNDQANHRASDGARDGIDDTQVFSRELCGGTHVHRTADIGLVSIVSEGAVAAGIRRVEALTGHAARRHLNTQKTLLKGAAMQLKVPGEKVPERLSALLAERKTLERQLIDVRQGVGLAKGAGGAGDDAQVIEGVKFIGRVLDGVPAKQLRGIVDTCKQELGSGVAAVVGVADDGKGAIVVGVTQDLTPHHSAIDLVRAGAKALGGTGGGGRPDMAQAGGPRGARAHQAVDAVRDALRASLV